ncbi:unnamed protein product [Spirodela intermedia]|uniref:Uncharacterized protein n=1 Tax=Spirodela intermedia TaxID=51605 RepID=A0A7I8IWH3_SPIIN|nr:unnamed protein product [Spirodela intermedia]CAA6661359.1 unnamed protein product [Spirodela intermedia]
MGRQVIFDGCHLVERKNGDFAALWWLSLDREELDGEVVTRRPMDHPLPEDSLVSSSSSSSWRWNVICLLS